jgi:hypothetical protein
MASAKAKRILGRLEEIKNEAVRLALDADDKAPWVGSQDGAHLAEEAAGLGLELADLLDPKGK